MKAQPRANPDIEAAQARGGRLSALISFAIRRDKIVEIDILADPARLRRVDLSLLNDSRD